MKTLSIAPIALLLAGLLGACGTTPPTRLLEQSRSDYLAAQNNPQVAKYAPLELQQAATALARANTAASDHQSTQDVDQLAYIAQQKIALAQEAAKQKAAEHDVENAGKARDQMRLNQRTNEANQARQATEVAQQQTQDAQARTAQLEAQLAELAAKRTPRGMMITLGDVLFATDRARLNQNGQDTVQKLATILQQYPERTVLIEGFTDSTGSRMHNQTLSERRAMAVRHALQEMGISRQRIAARGLGERYPVASNRHSEDRQLNRRVEIILSNDAERILPR